MDSITQPASRDSAEALARLAYAGAQFVLCDAQKRAINKRWQWLQPTVSEVLYRLSRGGVTVGIVPASISTVAVDVDAKLGKTWTDPAIAQVGRRAVVDALGEPSLTIDTPSGGFHCFYPSTAREGNRRWLLGDIRGARGYVVLWNAPAVAGMLDTEPGTPVDVSLLPKPRWVKDRGPVLVHGAPEGSRNETLNAEAFYDHDHGGISAAVRELYRLAATTAGLSDREADKTLNSVCRSKPSLPPKLPSSQKLNGNRVGTGREPLPEPVPGRFPTGSRPENGNLGTTGVEHVWIPFSQIAAAESVCPPVVLPGLAWRGMLSLFSSREKTGKTSLLSDALAAQGTGQLFLDAMPAQVRVGVVEEMAAPMWKRWLVDRNLPDDYPNLDYLPPSATPEQLRAYLQVTGAGLLVVDTLSPMLNTNSASSVGREPENDPSKVGKMVLALQAMAQEFGAAIMLIHHAGKAKDAGYRGSTSIGAGVDMVIDFRPVDAESDDRSLSYIGRWPQGDVTLVWSPQDGYRLRDTESADSRMERRIIGILLQHTEMTRSALAKLLRGRRQAAYDAINALVASGRVRVNASPEGETLTYIPTE